MENLQKRNRSSKIPLDYRYCGYTNLKSIRNLEISEDNKSTTYKY